MTETHTVDAGEAEELSHHPQPRQYVMVAVILGIVTALEVGIYYIDAIRAFLVPFLVLFAVIKFLLVALWFMHLRFDSKVFRRLFVIGILLALSVFAVVLVIFFYAIGGATPTVG